MYDIEDIAVELAADNFDEPTEAHIQAIIERLLVNQQWGLGVDGAVTVH